MTVPFFRIVRFGDTPTARSVNNVALFFLLFTALLFPQKTSRAHQSLPSPPQAIIAEAQRAAAISGRVLTGSPNSYNASEARDTGDTIWELTWVVNYEDVEVTVDEQQGRATEFHDRLVAKEQAVAFKNNALYVTTQTDAQSTLANLASQLPMSLGDWRNTVTFLNRVYGDGSGRPAFWEVKTKQYVNNISVGPRRLSAWIEPYQGRIFYWSLQDNADLVFPNGPILTETQAKQVAINAFTTYAASILTASDSTTPKANLSNLPGWVRVDDDATLTRLSYAYAFELPAIDDPNYDETNPNAEWHGRDEMLIAIRLDAETGEIWDIGNLLGSGSIRKPNVSVFSPRRNLLPTLLRDRSLNAFSLIMAGGKPVKATAPGKGARRFSVTATPSKLPSTDGLSEKDKAQIVKFYAPRTTAFAFNKTAHCVTWETAPGKWTGLALSSKQTSDLSDWLRRSNANIKGTARTK